MSNNWLVNEDFDHLINKQYTAIIGEFGRQIKMKPEKS